MTELYSSAYAAQQKKAYRTWLLICILSAAIAFAVCVGLCFFVSTRTAGLLFYLVAGISTLTGWAYILVLRPARKCALSQYKHCEGILNKVDSESEYLSGTISVSSYEVQIPGSIRVKTVSLSNRDGLRTLNLNARFSLPEGATTLTLRCAGSYITAYEVKDDA